MRITGIGVLAMAGILILLIYVIRTESHKEKQKGTGQWLPQIG